MRCRISARAAGAAVLVVALAVSAPRPAEARGSGVVFASIGLAKLLEDGAPDGSVGFGVGAIYRPASSPFAFGGEVGYLLLGTVNRTAIFTAGSAFAEVTVREVPVTAQLYYRLPRSTSAQFYADAGGGIYATTTKQSAQTLRPEDSTYGTLQETVTDPGVNFGGGVAFGRRETGTTIGVDGKLHVIFADGGSSTLLTLAARIFFD